MQFGEQLFDVVDDLDGIGAGLPLDSQNDGPIGFLLGVEPLEFFCKIKKEIKIC